MRTRSASARAPTIPSKGARYSRIISPGTRSPERVIALGMQAGPQVKGWSHADEAGADRNGPARL